MWFREFILRSHVWLLATFLPLLVKLVPLGRLVKLLTPPARFTPYVAFTPNRIMEIVGRRLRRPRNMRRRACLRKGLLLFHMLRLSGTPAVLHVGVFPPNGESERLRAHCWVSVGGRCVSDPPDNEVALRLTYSAQKDTFVSSVT